MRAEIGDGGVIDQAGFLEFIGDHFEARSFDELHIPLKVVATNYWDGSAVVFESGDLFTAIKASMAVPGLFNRVKLEDQLLIDGGVSNPLPWDLLEDHELVVAIDVTGTRKRDGENEADLFDLLFKTFEIMQQSIITGKMNSGEPAIYIKLELSEIRLLHFDRVDEVIEQAGEAAEELGRALDAFLLGPEAGFVTGQDWVVDGGVSGKMLYRPGAVSAPMDPNGGFGGKSQQFGSRPVLTGSVAHCLAHRGQVIDQGFSGEF